MRISSLDLMRYGLFTNTPVNLPQAQRDFHVIVGPNEAGKSTLRSAIVDLLYGIPKNTVHAFLHPMPDMRIGASIEHGGTTLEFQRTKGNKQTLQTRTGASLLESALEPFIGATDRDFFVKMFGLDHDRLVQGGHSILSAADDLGQILFQSAAGIGGLGAVREALETEADRLWSKRKSADRTYYIAADELERATAALKGATVRTKDWEKAYAEQVALEAAYTKARERHAEIKGRRSLLERVRRVTPHLNTLDDIEAQMTAIGEVPDLPPTAAKTLADAEKILAAAQADIERYAKLEREARSSIAQIKVDEGIRQLSPEVTELNERRVQYRSHERDIAKREAEVAAQWNTVVRLTEQLGWDSGSEALVLKRMPTVTAQASLSRLIRDHGALQLALGSAEESEKSKRKEIARANAALAALPASETPAALQAALAQAQKLGDFTEIARVRQDTVARCETESGKAFCALGNFKCDAASLQAMMPPAGNIINAYVQEQLADDAEAKAAATRVLDLNSQISQLKLEVAQFREAHQPVTREDVLILRQKRDSVWLHIKANTEELPGKAADYEKLIADADTLADTRHDKIQLATELQSKLQKIQGLELDRATEEASVQRLAKRSSERHARWESVAEGCGLPKIPFQTAAQWLEARKHALSASDALLEAKRLLAAHEAAVQSARVALAGSLEALAKPADNKALDVLMLEANGILQEIVDARGQRRTLARQITDAEHALVSLTEKVAGARAQFEDWRARWDNAIAVAGMPKQDDLGLVEGYLEVVKQIEVALAAMRKTRAERIDAMRADLAALAAAAQDLAGRIAPDIQDKAADEIALELARRLGAANEAYLEVKRQQSAAESARVKCLDATSRVQQAQATLAPLIERSKAATNAALAEVITRADKRRALLVMAEASEKAVRTASDGLTMEQLRKEVAAADVSTLLTEIDSLKGQDEALVNELSELSARRQAATAAVNAIGGSADAAKAEGQRQQALAKMADAVERYLKVYTAARLLKWSIEQYREAKQGPMLSLASTVFARLTLGSFERLTVDFDSEPLKLQGRRPGGAVVDIEGMSEGTRDQLYLALRLAALDMHLGQAHVLPFVADDLFINFDDKRATAGLEALGELSRKTQVLFLTHHDHLLPLVRNVFGNAVNISRL